MVMGGKIVLGLVLFCYLSVVIAADASRPLGDFTKSLPRKKFPVDDASNFDANDLLDYILSLVYVVAPGFAIGLLSVVVGVIYGLIKLCCCLCCKNRDDDDDEDEESHKSRHKRYGFMSRMIPSVIYILFICWIFAGCVIGWTSNGKMTNGVTTLSNAVSGVGSDALALGDSLLSNLHDIGDAIPQSFNDLLAQISGLPDISKKVVTLGNEVNSTQDDVSQITTQLRAINLNLTVLQDLDKQLSDITSQSKSVIGNVTELIDQVSDKLNNVLNDTIGNMNERLNEVESAIDDIIDQSNSFVGEAENMVKNIDGYVDQVKGYNKQRDSGLSAVYAVSFVTTIVGVLGWFFKKGLPFHVTAGFGFFFCFLFWISGSVHLLLGLVLSDVCPVVDPVLRSAIPKDGQAAAAINGCLNDTSLFVSLQLTDSFNLSEVFDYRSTFNQFTNFVDEFNFTEIDSYLVSINGLYNYNLTTAAQNLTAANLGWDQKYVYDALEALNNQTKPEHVFSVHNYTELDLSDYNPQQRRDRVNETYYVLDGLVKANATVYIELETARNQMIATQHAIEALVTKIDGYSDDFDVLQNNITDLSTKNVTTAIGIIQALEARVDHFFTLGDCSFVGRGYRAIMSSLCDTMQPADEMLAGSQYMIGLGLIAVIVLVEVLAVRVKYPDNSVDKYGDEKYDYNDDKNNSNSVSMSVQQDRNTNSNNY